MMQHIQEQLEKIAQQENVRILLACESGSRAWGFPSVDSDYDVRFIYVRPVEQYLRIDALRDVIERPISDDLDLCGWDLPKALGLLRKSNPALLEWLDSPIMYVQDRAITDRMRELKRAYFSKRACCEHYLSMARSNFANNIRGRATVRAKKYLYALRPLLCAQWLLEREAFPPTLFATILEHSLLSPDVRSSIARLIESKQFEREAQEGPPNPIFDDFIASALEELAHEVAEIAPTVFPVGPLNKLLRDVVVSAAARSET